MEPLYGSKGQPLAAQDLAGLQYLGRELRRARLGRGLTQAHLERLSGVDQSTISRLENGRLRSLRLVRVARLFTALDPKAGIGPLNDQTGST